jgi:serine/threonine protein kinase
MTPREAAQAPELIEGRYEVTRLLGQGAFARTVACLDRGEGGRAVAVKELRVQGVGDWKVVELFEREAEVLASLRHPAVPEIYRHFEGRESTLYLVMELIDGPSLLDELRRGRSLGDLEVTELALALLEVLEYLHGRLPPVFHRDIKPSNIVLRPSGVPVLVDFGGVCQGWRPPQGGSTVTGTFGYMPPEQLLGQVSPASDLYALGATLLHLVTGREPTEFSYDSGRLSLPAEAAVRPALRRTIDALLAPAPRDRPASARAARRLLLAEETALAPVPQLPWVLAVIPRGGRPELVEMGPPPRDPAGPLADVYANLIDPFPGRRPPRRRHPVWHAIGQASVATMVGVLMLGVPHLVFWGMRARRRRRLGPLFREGKATTGRLLSLQMSNEEAFVSDVTYEYEAGGNRHRARSTSSKHVLSHWAVGDPVTVLYDPAEPARSCVVYRWQPAPR